MPKDDKRGKSFWDDKEATDTGILRRPEKEPFEGAGARPGSGTAVTSTQIDQKIHEARVLMEQTHQLYQLYFNGVERRTPIEKVRLLEFKIGELQKISVNLTAARFKISQFLSQYSGMKELWERKLRELERK
ncbi:MAG: hypothetical protein KGP28_04940 [Bdellovibrionales bacterium]|nr:hypothetical protein [Bdellovibrionales bacterium]